MEGMKIYKDGERLVLMFEQSSPETENLILRLVESYVEHKIGIAVIENVKPVEEEIDLPFIPDENKEIRYGEKGGQRVIKKTKEPILKIPVGPYENMTMEEAYLKNGAECFPELVNTIKLCSDNLQKKLLKLSLVKVLDLYEDEFSKKEISDASEEELNQFLETMSLFIDLSDILSQAGCGNITAFLYTEPVLSKRDAALTITENYFEFRKKYPI